MATAIVTSVRAQNRRRGLAAGLIVALLSTTIIGTFWYQDWRYSLPAPVPANWNSIPLGKVVTLPPEIAALRRQPDRPLCLNFFNPSCPCSRFNADHLLALAREFRGQAEFIAIVPSASPQTIAAAARILPGLTAVGDTDGKLAKRYGVYATPQAVLLNSANTLVFRGNYNISRYCTSPKTQFARLATSAVVLGQKSPVFPASAVVAYGCPWPATTTDLAASENPDRTR